MGARAKKLAATAENVDANEGTESSPDPDPSQRRYENRVGGFVEIQVGGGDPLRIYTDQLKPPTGEPVVFETNEKLEVSLQALKNILPSNMQAILPDSILGTDLADVSIQLSRLRLTTDAELGVSGSLIFSQLPELAGIALAGVGVSVDRIVAPQISGVEPQTAAVGGSIALLGSHLNQPDAKVIFTGGQEGEIVGEREFGRITVVVPEGAQSGPISLHTWSGTLTVPDFSVQ